MAQLIVRNIDEDLVRRLKVRAAQHGHSMEAEHRAILRASLAPEPRDVTFKEWLTSMPDVGLDEDFLMPRDLPRSVD
jgi:plasmid stability protein